MTSAASSPLASSVEKSNGAKLSRLVIDGGTTVLRKVFDRHHPPANLIADFNSNYSILNNLLRRRVLNRHQWTKLFLPSGAAPDSHTFDITLLFLLLSNISGLTPPPSGWHTKPPPSDTSREANLARVKFYRNILYGHVTTTGVDTPTFSALWTEISGVLVNLGLDQADVDRLRAEEGGEQDYVKVLIDWADSEEDIKSQLKEVHQSQTITQQAVENVRQTQVKTQKTVKDIHKAQTKTQKKVEDIHQAQTKTQQSVENVTQNVTEVAAGLKEIKKTVESLKEGRDNDKADEVLRNLTNSEFRGDIEYFAERFQEGTREWVFDRVQNWLDDRSCQNRVMVISGNAGMGKSIIAAAICKRMQKTGRLSGSHFCQYNNVRYSKPQLIIQSLACHLSHALPEYKQALVKQLSRNVGIDLNNMGVEELFALLFKEPLSAVGDPGRNMLMVIDGLDESEYQGRNDLLDVIASQFCKLPIWIRFFITTRAALNIAEKLKHLKPFELKSDDKKNLEDIRVFFVKKLQYVVNPEHLNEVVGKLVLKSEGLMLYAHFLVLTITENASPFLKGDLDDILPEGISSVYHSYFKRLENELVRELGIEKEHFLNLVSAITAAREPLPVSFVSKVLVPVTNSPLAKRTVSKALGSVSTLLPIRYECLHVIHKSVKDWLTDTSCYGEHEFITGENEGHRILADLCTEELDYLKRRGVDNVQFSTTERYALYHGARHMLHKSVKREPHKLDELTKACILDLEIVYAKTCVNSTLAAEDLVWLKKEGVSTVLSEDNQSILDTLLFLLRKYRRRFTDAPRIFLQTVLNQGGKVLTVEASNLLRIKYPEITYMEIVLKEMHQGGVVAQFQCSSHVACLDVSPQLDYMVCECNDGKLQLWSLLTGRLLWTRPVIITKTYNLDISLPIRKLPSADITCLFRSVVFHPTREVVLPGSLSQAYTMDGDLTPLFPGSNCRFSVCSISGDKTKILTNCLKDSKCLVLWSLQNGSLLDRIQRDDDILSFAWSRNERLLAISHSSGSICLVDMMHGCSTRAKVDVREVCGVVKFSPDYRSLFCCQVKRLCPRFFCLRVIKETPNTFSFEGSDDVTYNFENFQSFNDCGFSSGDLFTADHLNYYLTFVLDDQRLLQCTRSAIEMVDTKKVNKRSQDVATKPTGIALSLDGQTVYVASDTSDTAWDAERGKLKAERNVMGPRRSPLCPVKGGVLIPTEDTVEWWDYSLSKCIKTWSSLSGVKQIIPISEGQVAFIRVFDVKVVDARSGEIVSTIPVLDGSVLTLNSKCQLLTLSDSGSLQLLDGASVWKKDVGLTKQFCKGALFSPMEQFLIVWMTGGLLVLDAQTGNRLHILPSFPYQFRHCKFISDENCVFYRSDVTVALVNVKSGELLSVIDVESEVSCLTACPLNRLLAIGLQNNVPSIKVIRVHLPRDEHSKNGKG